MSSLSRVMLKTALGAVSTARAIDPLAAPEQGLRWLIATVAHLMFGLAIGLLAARVMRRRHLHWTWAVGALVIVEFARQTLAGATVTLASAALCAAVRGRRWHREDLEAGADLAEIARRRLGPQEVLAYFMRGLRARFARLPWEVESGAGQLTVGHDERGRIVRVPLDCSTHAAHTLVVGATGSGKTVTQTLLALSAIELGAGAIVVDPKGDRAMRVALEGAAHAARRRFIEWSPNGPTVYNPYAFGSETEIADKVLAGERFTEPHYQRQAQRYLGHVVRALRAAELDVCLRAVVDCLAPARLEELARGLPEAYAQVTYRYLDSLTSRQQGDLAGVRDRLAILVESDVGAWLDPATTRCERFDLLSVVRSRSVVYFDLQADRRPLLTQMLGAAIVQDLLTTIAALQAAPIPTLAVIDEFSSIAAEQVVRLFARARSAGVSLVLGTQELSDLRLPGREGLLERVMGNLSLLIAHRQVVPDSAQLIASLAPSKGVWRTSRHGDGATTRTRIREGVLTPQEITALGTGYAAVIALSDGCATRIARIQSPPR